MQSMSMCELLQYPLQGDRILLQKRKIYKELSAQENLIEKRIAILSGSTIGHIRDILEIFLLYHGIRPLFHIGAYDRFYEDALYDIQTLQQFNPEYIYIHTTNKNILYPPIVDDNENAIEEKIIAEYKRFETVWNTIFAHIPCTIIQNNFEMPLYRPLGNLDASTQIGLTYYTAMLNMRIAKYAQKSKNFYVNDIHYMAADYGLSKWHHTQQWHMYKYAMDINAIPVVCQSIANIIKSTLGKNKKLIILDLDNTLWGGLVGEDGAENLQIGLGTPQGEAYCSFQQYVLSLKRRGILLAICSKNNVDAAKSAFDNDKMILKWDDFVLVKANWNDKASNVMAIAKELNLSTDSFIFIDDNPAERELILQKIKDIVVNDENDVETFIRFIDKNGFFEATIITEDDAMRNDYYKKNSMRLIEETQFIDYDAYLASLDMTFQFENFQENNIDRVVQLINKTNQFNLTAKRMTMAALRDIMNDNNLNIAVGLKDKFGDNGLISVFSGTIDTYILHINLWLMSCRVFKRNVEYKLFDYILNWCEENGIQEITGHYIETEKNKMVSGFYEELGFAQQENGNWIYHLKRV